MKVCMINTVFPRGSTGRIFYDIGQKLVENGDDFFAAYKYKDCIDNANSFVRNNMDVSICVNRIMKILSE